MNRSEKSRTNVVVLRDVTASDLDIFFEHQRDPAATRMAAFSARDRVAFMTHWRERVLGDNTVIKKTVLVDDEVAGNIVCYPQAGQHLVGYWIGRVFWGRGIATRALTEFVARIDARPLHAYVAKHNVGSVRVLEKCGFTPAGEGVAPACDGEDSVEEFVFTLGT